MISDPDWNRINRACCLDYYNDQDIPSIREPVYVDHGEAFPNTFQAIYSHINRHLDGNPQGLFEVETFTLFSLAQYRHGNGGLSPSMRDGLLRLAPRLLDPGCHAVRSNDRLYYFLEQSALDLNQTSFRVGKIIEDLYRIKEQGRSRWIAHGLHDVESIPDHVYGAFLLGKVFLPEKKDRQDYDKSQILNLVLIHDLAKAMTGDTLQKSEDDLNMERHWFRSFGMRSTYEAAHGAWPISRLWEEFRNRQPDSLNARIATDLDKLDCLVQLYIYHLREREAGKSGISDFERRRDETWQGLTTDEGGEIEQIISEHFALRLAKQLEKNGTRPATTDAERTPSARPEDAPQPVPVTVPLPASLDYSREM